MLLEADLEMKLVSARLQKTDTELGRRFVDAMQGNKCYLGRRLWIVPQPAEVHEDGDQLSHSQHAAHGEDRDRSKRRHSGHRPVPRPGSRGHGPQRSAVPADDHAALVDAVNHNPDFADLRRVYTSRVAAEWYRKRNANKPTQYAKLIDSGNIDDLTVSWDPHAVWGALSGFHEAPRANLQLDRP